MKKIVNGTSYQSETPESLISVLETIRKQGTRVRVLYGDVKSGVSWNDDALGRIGRSTGPDKIPLIVHNKRSLGGPALLDDCILQVKESKGGKTLWSHPVTLVKK